MPYSVNGFGTGVVPGRGLIRWTKGESPDCDAVVCLIVAFLPIVPLACVHTYGWRGEEYRQFSLGTLAQNVPLMARAFARRYLSAGLLLAVFLGTIAFLQFRLNDTASGLLVMLSAAIMGTMTSLGLWMWMRTDRRQRAIRYVIGRTRYGSSDPATWAQGMLATVDLPPDRSHARTARWLLSRQDFPRAMFHARVSRAIEAPVEADTITDTILATPRVLASLRQIRRDPSTWERVMGPADTREAGAT